MIQRHWLTQELSRKFAKWFKGDFFGEELGSFFKMGEPLVVRTIKRQFEDVTNLKDLLEAEAEGSA